MRKKFEYALSNFYRALFSALEMQNSYKEIYHLAILMVNSAFTLKNLNYLVQAGQLMNKVHSNN